jgi:hypothetical protein
VALLAYFHGTGTPTIRMSLYADAGSLPGDLLAVVEGQAPRVQGWHELGARPDPPPVRERNHFGQSLFC